MPIDLEERGQALEDEYFRRKEQELLKKMKAKIDSENVKHLSLKCLNDNCGNQLKEVDFENIKIDICEKCGGVWLDGGELAQLMNKENNEGWFNRLFN